MRKRYKLQNTVLLSFTLLAVVLVLVISSVVGTQYVEKDGDGKYFITDSEGVTTYIEDEKYLNQIKESEEKNNGRITWQNKRISEEG